MVASVAPVAPATELAGPLPDDGGARPSPLAALAERRDAVRAHLLATEPWWYSPWVHLAVPSVFGLGIIAACIAFVAARGLVALELLTVPAMWLLANASEWRAHRDLLHRRSRIAPLLYDRHTPEHHVVYTTNDMAMQSVREFRLVLIPAYGIALIFIGTLPLTAALYFAGLPNVAALQLATSMFYVVSYEWLHLSYHLPPTSFIGRRRIIRALRRHHAIHHHPQLMQRWNFNVTVPVWDFVRGTVARGATLDGVEPAIAEDVRAGR